MVFMQGDAYYIPFYFFADEETQITEDMVDDVEIIFGKVRKTYSDGEILYNDGAFLFPLTQAESSAMSGTVRVRAQVTFNAGDVIGSSMGHAVCLPFK